MSVHQITLYSKFWLRAIYVLSGIIVVHYHTKCNNKWRRMLSRKET
jgi:hypothetical protein